MTDASCNKLLYLQYASVTMEKLIQFSASRIETIDTSFKHYLWNTIGGRNKNRKQITGIQDAFVAAHNIEYAQHNKIPLWLFGFLY